MTVGSLFAGIGGFDLAASRVWGWDCVRWQVEIDPWCRRVLAKHWPDVPKHGDIRELTGDELEPVDLVCGGFPCQDLSVANVGGQGLAGSRSGLWGEFARLIGALRPRYVVVENVPNLLNRGVERVLGDLAALGFDAEWHCIPAAYVGAPHGRDRLWIMAHPSGSEWGTQHQARYGLAGAQRLSQRAEGPGGPSSVVSAAWPARPGEVGRIPRAVDGLSRRMDRLRGLGNAIVPQVAERLFRWIDEAESLHG